MLQVTFLGWQGWMLDTGASRLLVDPLLIDAIGRGPLPTRQLFLTWPPREFCWAELPPVDAIFISHEHEDHFNIPSLARIDRQLPIWLSARSSLAARTLLRELGFTVELVEPGRTMKLADLELQTFAGDHRGGEQQDEWDTLAYLVAGDDGVFFTNVDVGVTPDMRNAVTAASTAGMPLCFVSMALALGLEHHHAGESAHHRRPDAAARLGASEALQHLCGGGLLSPLAGQTASLRAHELVELTDRTAFLATRQRSEWPAPVGFWPAPGTPPVALLGGEDLDDGDIEALELELDRLAAYLYGRALFRELLSLSPAQLRGRRPSFVLVLQAGSEGAYVYRYEPQSCSFVALDAGELAEIEAGFAGVVFGWAGDLLAALRGRFEPRALVRSLRERWFVPMTSGFLVQSLWPFLHPLNQPDRCLAQYREAAEAEREAPILVRGR